MLQALIEAEAAQHIGAQPYERTETRTTHRNGTRSRLLSTKAGDVELRIPKLREGSFFPALLEPRRRIDRALCSLHDQHPRNRRLLQAAKTEPRLATASTTRTTHSSPQSSSQLDQRCGERSPAVAAPAGWVQVKPG